jgi:hypothetical protein
MDHAEADARCCTTPAELSVRLPLTIGGYIIYVSIQTNQSRHS